MALYRAPEHRADDDYIVQTPVSKDLKRAFLYEFLHDRRRNRTTEMLFARAGSFRLEQLASHTSARPFGFKMIVFKGSFVDGAAWGALSAQGYADVMEEFLLRYFETQLREAVEGHTAVDVERDLQQILEALDETFSDLRARGYEPSLFVLTGQVGQQLYNDLQGALLPPRDVLVSPPLQTRQRIIGVHAASGTPVLDIAQSPAPALYAVDLARFASLTRYGKGPDFEPEFNVEEFEEARAREILAQQPRLILDPPPDSPDEEERIRQLRLRVGLELWETYELNVNDPDAVVARPLVGPPVDY